MACYFLRNSLQEDFLSDVLSIFADYGANAMMPLLISVFMLLAFRNVELFHGRKTIKVLGTTTIGVYLFHDNVNYRGVMWNDVGNFVSWDSNILFAARAGLSILLVFVVGCVIEMMRAGCVKYVRMKCASLWSK